MQARKERKSGDGTLLFLSHNTKAISISVIAGSIFGLIIELLQPFFDRNCDYLDFIADFLGVVLGIAIGIILLDIFLVLVMDKSVWYDVMHETEQKH